MHTIFTLYKSTLNPISKRFIDGKLQHPGTLKQGKAFKIKIKNVAELQEIVDGSSAINAFGFGTYEENVDAIKITCKGSEYQILERTKENFKYRDNPGFLLIDYDPVGTPLHRDQLLEAYQQAVPELEQAPTFWKTSSSSCINGSPIKGQHFLVSILDSKDIERLNTILFKRLWLSGHGYIFIDKAGRMHPRTIMDKAVNSPERLCFIKADVKEPDHQDIQTKIYNNSNKPIDTSSIPDLSTKEENDYNELVNAAKALSVKNADKQTEVWIDKQVKKGHSRKNVLKMRESEVLNQDFEILLSDGTNIFVSELLKNPEVYHGQRCYDPFEPEIYDYFSKVAYLDLISTAPRIFSHAHGGKNYNLEVYVEEKEIITIAKKSEKITRHDWPPGFVGVFAKEIWERMPWPHKEISIISARHVTRSLLGRKASFQASTLSQINILLADQGVGKDTPNKVLNDVIEQLIMNTSNDLLKCYRGSKGTYGVKALHVKLIRSPSMSVIIPEAGIASKSQSGDVWKVKQYIMQNIVKGSYSPYDVSDFADALPDVYGTTLSILEESTQTSYVHNFTQDSINSGDEARKFHHFATSEPCSKPRKLAYSPFSESIIDKLKMLVMEANRGENFEYQIDEESKFMGPSLKNVEFNNYVLFQPDDYTQKVFEEMVDKEYILRKKGNSISEAERSMFVREIAQVKSEALLYAYIESILNGTANIVNKIHIDYAISYVKECKRSMKANMGNTESSDSRLVQAIVEFMLEKLHTKGYKHKHNKQEQSHSLFKHSYLTFGTNQINTIASGMENHWKRR